MRSHPSSSATRTSAGILHRALQPTHGLGVRPAAYDETNGSTTQRSNSPTHPGASWRMPNWEHTAAASAAARSVAALSRKRHVTPTTSYPARMSSAAETALSTPPLIPSAMRPLAFISGTPPVAPMRSSGNRVFLRLSHGDRRSSRRSDLLTHDRRSLASALR